MVREITKIAVLEHCRIRDLAADPGLEFLIRVGSRILRGFARIGARERAFLAVRIL